MRDIREVGIGVVGLGSMGRIHAGLAAATRGARLVAVADVNEAAAQTAGDEFGVPHFLSGGELLKVSGMDAVIIATPAETHADILVAAASAGNDILCEKPLDCRLDHIDEALSDVAAAGVHLQVGFNRRFDRNFLAVKEEVDASRVGDIISIHIVSRDPLLPGPPRTIGDMSGLFFDTTVHDFDMLRFLTGSEIVIVDVQAAPAVHRQAEIDTAVILVRMANGVIGTIDNGQAAHGYDQRVEVFGTKGAISMGNEIVSTTSFVDQSGSHRPGPPYFYPQRYGESYARQIESFLGCIRDGVAPQPSGADGRAASVAALAAQRSADEGRPVRTSEIR